MRVFLFQAITTDTTLVSMGIDPNSSFAVDVDTPLNRPFLQIRWGRNDEGLDQVTRRTVTIWVHDQPGDYSKIDAIILQLRTLLPTLEGQSNGLGHLVGVVWTGDSEDLIDDGHRTIARWTSFELVGSGQ